MDTAAWLATALDHEQLEVSRGVVIAPRRQEDYALTVRYGPDVAQELGGRYLLRYILPEQVNQFADGSTATHHVTPTPYAPRDTVSYLALPKPVAPRLYVMLLDPARIPYIQGPRWIRLGKGIEYILPRGFPKDALVMPWEVEVT
jgi:hypothetical protein